MSYSSKKEKEQLDRLLAPLLPVGGSGALQYCITKLLLEFVAPGKENHLDRDIVNIATGVLANVTHEFYRKVVIPYENTAQLTTGDMFQDLIKKTGLRTL